MYPFYQYQFDTEHCSKEDEAVMKAIVSNNETDLMEALVSYKDKIDVHKICTNGTTIACAAVKTGNLNIVKAILENNCEKLRSSKRLRKTHHLVELPRKELSNPVCLYRSNLDVGTSLDYEYSDATRGKISQLDNYGKNLLHYAILEDNLEIVKYLLENFKELNCNQVDRNTKSPLHLAVERENIEMVKFLLTLGATVDLKDNEGKTPLHNASEKGSLKIIETLLEAKSDINALDYTGQSTLILATVYNRSEAVELLLKRGVRVNYEDDLGFTALKRAIYVRNSKVTRILIQNGARICESLYFLHHAVIYNQLNIVDSLIDGGARLETKDYKGMTPLMYAIECKNYRMTKYLLGKGADPNNTNSHSGTTCLHISMFYIEEPEVIDLFIDILIKYGANVYTRCRFGFDALYYAFSHKNDAAACNLIRRMDVNFRHNNMRLDYMSSCMYYCKTTEPIKWLLLAGFDMKNFVDKPKTPIPVEKMNKKEKFLHDFLCTTLSLKDLCRIQIRRLVRPNNLSELPLPSTLHKYLKMENLFFNSKS